MIDYRFELWRQGVYVADLVKIPQISYGFVRNDFKPCQFSYNANGLDSTLKTNFIKGSEVRLYRKVENVDSDYRLVYAAEIVKTVRTINEKNQKTIDVTCLPIAKTALSKRSVTKTYLQIKEQDIAWDLINEIQTNTNTIIDIMQFLTIANAYTPHTNTTKNAFSFIPNVTGKLVSLKIYGSYNNPSAGLKGAFIHADNAGEPAAISIGTMNMVTETQTPDQVGWITAFAIFSPTLTAGTKYWIVINSDVGGIIPYTLTQYGDTALGNPASESLCFHGSGWHTISPDIDFAYDMRIAYDDIGLSLSQIDFGITQGTLEETNSSRDREYIDAKPLQELQQLANVLSINPPQTLRGFRITPDLVDDSYLEFSYFANYGETTSILVDNYYIQEVSQVDSIESLSNQIIALGKDGRKSIATSSAGNLDLYKLRRDYISRTNIETQSVLDAEALQEVGVTAEPEIVYNIILRPNADIIGQFREGDFIKVEYTDSEGFIEIDDYFRVFEIDITYNEKKQEQVSLKIALERPVDLATQPSDKVINLFKTTAQRLTDLEK